MAAAPCRRYFRAQFKFALFKTAPGGCACDLPAHPRRLSWPALAMRSDQRSRPKYSRTGAGAGLSTTTRSAARDTLLIQKLGSVKARFGAVVATCTRTAPGAASLAGFEKPSLTQAEVGQVVGGVVGQARLAHPLPGAPVDNHGHADHLGAGFAQRGHGGQHRVARRRGVLDGEHPAPGDVRPFDSAPGAV